MSWNYRLIKHVVCINDHVNRKKFNVVSYGIHEVYYDKNGRPKMYTEEGAHVISETPEECAEIIGRMAAAFLKPVLTDKDFIKPKPKRKGKK